MSDGITDIKDLVHNLSAVKTHLENIANSLERLEQNEIESIKSSFELKGDIKGDLSSLKTMLDKVEQTTARLNEKVTERLLELSSVLSNIKESIITAIDRRLKEIKVGDISVKVFSKETQTSKLIFHFYSAASDDEARLSQLCLWVLECEKENLPFMIQMPNKLLNSAKESIDEILEYLARY